MNQNQMDFDIRGDEVREECERFWDFTILTEMMLPPHLLWTSLLLQHRGTGKAAVLVVSDYRRPKKENTKRT